jgi:Methylated DNA-protein cysteine methyltransferase
MRRDRPAARLSGAAVNSSTPIVGARRTHAPRGAALASTDGARPLLCPVPDRDRRLRDRLGRSRPHRRLVARGFARSARAARAQAHAGRARHRAASRPQGSRHSDRSLARRRTCHFRLRAPRPRTHRCVRPPRLRRHACHRRRRGPHLRRSRGPSRPGRIAARGRPSLGRNPWPIVVPCHRVVAAGTALGGFSAPGGTTTTQRLLAIERARRTGAPDLFDPLPRENAAVGFASGGETPARH